MHTLTLQERLSRIIQVLSKEHKDSLPGGLADEYTPNDFDVDLLQEGIWVELEHTDDFDLAREITMDHLVEDTDYYKKLKQVESH